MKKAYIILSILLTLLSAYDSKSDTVDVMPPFFSIKSSCSEYLVSVFDNRKFPINKDTFQLDAGIRIEPTVLSKSYNFSSLILDSNFKQDLINYQFSFRLNVVDKFDTAFAVFYVYDEAPQRNIKFDSIKYYPQLLRLNPESINFGFVYVDSLLEREIEFKNVAGFEFLIREITLKYGKSYSIQNEIPKLISIKSDSSIKLLIRYNPKTEIQSTDKFENDTLIIKTECLTYKIPLTGKGVISRIESEDFDFGIVEVGQFKYKTKIEYPNTNDGLNISNPGTGVLKLTGYSYHPEDSPFFFVNPYPDPLNAQLFPGVTISVKEICFKPPTAGEFFGDIVFSNNAIGTDSISKFRGIGYFSGPFITSLNFNDKRVMSKSVGYISIKNSGDKPYSLGGFELFNNENGDFRIIVEDLDVNPSFDVPVVIYPQDHTGAGVKEFVIPIEFKPKSEGFKEIKIRPIFVESGKDLELIVFNYIRGYGILPKIEALGYSFSGKTVVNNLHKDTGYVFIKSISQTSDLFIKSINYYKVTNPNLNDFTWLISKFPQDTIIKRGSLIKLPVIFRPEEAGERLLRVEIVTDAITGDFNKTVWDTTNVFVSGYGFNKVIAIDHLKFEDVYHCDTSERKLIIRNVSDSVTALIMDIKLESGDLDAFEIDKEYILNNLVYLKPHDTLSFKVKFKPFVSDTNDFSVSARLYSDVDTSLTFIKGTSKKFKVYLKMDSISNGIPGMITINRPPEFFGTDYPVRLSGDFLSKSYIDSIYFELIYNNNDFKFLGVIENGEIIPDWFIRFKEEKFDNDRNVLKINVNGNNPVVNNGILLYPVFMVMLGDTNGIRIQLANSGIFSEKHCNDLINQDGIIKLSYCGEKVRKLIISRRLYDMMIISKNPSQSDNLKLQFTLALNSHTELNIYNHFGQKVRNLVNNFMEEGTYEIDEDITELTSGIYYITIHSGPYHQTKKLILSR